MSLLTHVAYAAESTGNRNIAELVSDINRLIFNPFIIFLFALALLLFFSGMIQFVAIADKSSESAQKGKQHMMWGLVGMFIMFTTWGIINVIINTFGIDLPQEVVIPG